MELHTAGASGACFPRGYQPRSRWRSSATPAAMSPAMPRMSSSTGQTALIRPTATYTAIAASRKVKQALDRLSSQPRRLKLDIAIDLPAPGVPAGPAPSGKQLQVRARAAALDDGVLLLRLVAVLLQRRVQP